MPLSLSDIYTYAKDQSDLNILLEGSLQSSAPLITLAMKLAVSEFNSTAPVTSYSVENFPSDSILLYGTLHHLANSEAERQLRNQVNYSAQGVSAGLDDKFQQYQSLSSFYRQLYDTKAVALKQYLNQEEAWGGEFSPYVMLNQWNYRS